MSLEPKNYEEAMRELAAARTQLDQAHAKLRETMGDLNGVLNALRRLEADVAGKL